MMIRPKASTPRMVVNSHAELRALGHEVRLMPAQYVKAYDEVIE
jgi:transposase